MCDTPSAFTTAKRKARKCHTCCECGSEIQKGEQYQYSSGIWDGDPGSFKQCLTCHEIMHKASLTEYEPPGFCGLLEWFRGFECRGFTGQDWLNGTAKDIGLSPEKLNKLLKVT